MLSVREICASDIPFITNYWLGASDEYLLRMGAEPSKMLSSEEWNASLKLQIESPVSEKTSFGTIWVEENQPIGHCNINQIEFGKQAHMHLHIWTLGNRMRGFGKKLVTESLKLFFEKFELKKVVCEPNSKNIAPNTTLEKVGFTFIKEYTTIPGSINFEQSVKRWEITLEQFNKLNDF